MRFFINVETTKSIAKLYMATIKFFFFVEPRFGLWVNKERIERTEFVRVYIVYNRSYTHKRGITFLDALFINIKTTKSTARSYVW